MMRDGGFTWRRTEIGDAPALTAIYNESADDGGHSPALRRANEAEIAELVRQCKRMRWPTWVLVKDEEVIGWAHIRPIAWGPEVSYRTGDVSIYVRQDWHGRGAAMRVARNLYLFGDYRRQGFTALTCWILGGNHKSLMMARAFRFAEWGRLPSAACHGDRVDDVVIYGVRLDDERWLDFMEEQQARFDRRARNRR